MAGVYDRLNACAIFGYTHAANHAPRTNGTKLVRVRLRLLQRK